MYSKNDYRYYLENQLVHSDDFLAHYGVKGMKWKQHKKSNLDINNDVIVPDKIERDKIVRDKIVRDTGVSKPIRLDQERGKKRTIKEKTRRTINADQDRGRKRTAQLSKKSTEYLTELEYNSKKNNFPKSTVNTTPKKKKKKLKDRFKPKNQKVEVIYRKDNKTGEVYKK